MAVNTCLATCGQSVSSYSYGFSSGSVGYCCGAKGTCESGPGCTADIFQCTQTCSTLIVTPPPVIPRYPNSVSSSKPAVCNTDADCPVSARCVLHQCFAVTTIASLPVFCGNARIDAGEQCDDGMTNSNLPNAHCRPDCTFGRCGDGVIDSPQEQCDDGNNIPGDGCSAACLPERAAPPATLPAQVIELPFTAAIITQTTPTANNATTITDTNVNDQTRTSDIPSTPSTGPASLVIMLAGGVAGWLYRKRR